MSHGWTLQRRQRQAEAIRNWSPWKQATGPRTAAGKAQSSRNAFKGGRRAALTVDLAHVRALIAEITSEAPW